MKDLERSSQIAQVHPKSDDRCPSSKQKRRQTHRGEDCRTTEAAIRVTMSQVKEWEQSPEPKEAKKDSLLKQLEGA